MLKKISVAIAAAFLAACTATNEPKPATPEVSTTAIHPEQHQPTHVQNEAATPAGFRDAQVDDATAETQLAWISNAELTPEQKAQFDNLWLRIQRQSQLKIPQHSHIHDDIAVQRRFYARNQRFLNQVSVRAQPFLYYIVAELERRNMPVEIALLPIVESAFNPTAQANGPAGLWQMVPGTARNFGLTINAWYDGRKDPIASTHAALDYLQHLYDNLDRDWLNAVAAYNTGELRIQRAIANNKARGKPTDFWSLSLPRQSIVYMPKWLALVDILQSPEKYNVQWQFIANQPRIGVAKLKGAVDLQQAAKAAGLSLSELKTLNPGFRRQISSPTGPHRLTLPLEKIAEFEEQAYQLTLKQLPQQQFHRIKKGDTLEKIAKKYQVSVAALKAANPRDSKKLKAGRELLIPDVASASVTTQASHQTKTTAKSTATTATYQVKSGDNLWTISKALGVSHSALLSANQLTAKSTLKVGQRLKVPAAAPTSSKKGRAPSTHTVKTGESLDKIAKRYKVSVAQLLKWNNLSADSVLQIGQKLKVGA
jgi:membrane-bound lytic murein transglycosylase D